MKFEMWVSLAGAVIILVIVAWVLALLATRHRPAQGGTAKEGVIVDGSNVMHWGGDPSVKALQAVIGSLIARRLEPFVVFDANVGYKLSDRYLDDAPMAEMIGLSADRVLVVEKGVSADERILAMAREHDACVVSNDRFRDWTVKHPWVRKKGRMMRGTYRNGAVKWQ